MVGLGSQMILSLGVHRRNVWMQDATVPAQDTAIRQATGRGRGRSVSSKISARPSRNIQQTTLDHQKQVK
ncbi:hypothetical protein E2C01_050686 [Portunus trituberculatus]|uniref:Uncharacterized protein n=1 Tax=Portunus trituberculatus TaxID=210409 RepID=A0A5B7G9M9_PORTR|nr:hypothetical protein [Portunus trituberculatus]